MPETPSDQATPARHARLFRNGRNQAVRIPREFELQAGEVMTFKEDDRLVLVPVNRSPTLAEILSGLTPLEEDFPQIDDPAVEPTDIF